MSKVITPDGHEIQVVESYDRNGEPLLEIRDLSPHAPWTAHIKLNKENLLDLMYEFAKAKIKLEERT